MHKWKFILFFLFLPSMIFSQTYEEILEITGIERVPVFPGCRGDNEELKTCLNQRIKSYFGEYFNIKVFNKTDLSGIQRLDVLFVINNKGKIVNIEMEGAHPKIEKEVKRVLNKIPEVIPGEQEGIPVSIQYALPLVFEIR